LVGIGKAGPGMGRGRSLGAAGLRQEEEDSGDGCARQN
jgi:hypothetical protein